MIWQVRIHKLVLNEDLDGLGSEKEQILRTLRKKLSLDPEGYGKPLVGEFKGYWRLRIGEYRVIYRIVKQEVLVFVVKIGIRRDERVYLEFTKRLNKI